MKVASVIAEFNPLHNAHKYILDTTKEKGYDLTVVILGGNFMQRGEVSIMDCYDRAESAVLSGADLVLLLPYVYSAQTAEVFAWGGVSIAEKIGSDALFFGSEDDTLPFYDVAKLLRDESAEFKEILRSGLSQGFSFAKSRENAIREILGEAAAECVRGANNILSTEYIKSIVKLNSRIVPRSIKRVSSSISATKIREKISSEGLGSVKEYLPPGSFEILERNTDSLHFRRDFEQIIFNALLIFGGDDISDIAEVEEGLHNRIYTERYALLDGMTSYEDRVSTKRYTRSRVRRILYNTVIGYTKSHLAKAKTHDITSAIALAANKNGRELIKRVNKQEDFRIISNLSKEYEHIPQDSWIYDIEIKAYEIYHQKENMSLLKNHCRII